MKVRTGDDGKTEFIFRQSSINTFLMCPEQARLEMVDELPDDTTDAAAIGTALHSGVEWVLLGGSPSWAPLAIESAYRHIENTEGIRYVQSRSATTAIGKSVKCFEAWYAHVYPQLPEMVAIEERFEVPLVEKDDCRILLRGMIDAVDELGVIWDWKTANQPYELWQLQRYYVQPTAYTYAWACLQEAENTGGDWDFTYAVMSKSARKPQVLTVTRNAGHWTWLQRQCESIIEMLRADLSVWPLRDAGWHCSPKWCGAYDNCKGQHVAMRV